MAYSKRSVWVFLSVLSMSACVYPAGTVPAVSGNWLAESTKISMIVGLPYPSFTIDTARWSMSIDGYEQVVVMEKQWGPLLPIVREGVVVRDGNSLLLTFEGCDACNGSIMEDGSILANVDGGREVTFRRAIAQ